MSTRLRAQLPQPLCELHRARLFRASSHLHRGNARRWRSTMRPPRPTRGPDLGISAARHGRAIGPAGCVRRRACGFPVSARAHGRGPRCGCEETAGMADRRGDPNGGRRDLRRPDQPLSPALSARRTPQPSHRHRRRANRNNTESLDRDRRDGQARRPRVDIPTTTDRASAAAPRLDSRPGSRHRHRQQGLRIERRRGRDHLRHDRAGRHRRVRSRRARLEESPADHWQDATSTTGTPSRRSCPSEHT